jgi:hypothetical protein
MTTRRTIIGAALAVGLRATASVRITDVAHVKLHGSKSTYCGHPRQGGIFYFGGGEIAVLHNHAPCAYSQRTDVQHDYGGYHSRSVLLLQRSLDDGSTWPADQELVVANEAAPLAARQQLLLSSLMEPRAAIDLSKPGAIVVFPRTFLGPVKHEVPQMVSYALRSPDKGKSWEKVPFVLVPPPGGYSASPDNTPIVRLPDGTFVFPMRTFGGRKGVDLYASTDRGGSWQYRRHICEPHHYPALVLLKSGRLQCYNYPIAMCYSDDGGMTWSRRKLIEPRDPSAWAPHDPFYREELTHRSPTPLVLRDGRILLFFARRVSAQRGIGVMVSEDGGATWSPDLILRDGASAYQTTKVGNRATDYSDIGYPVATQLDDGRIFVAYYFMVADGNNFGGSRFIAGTFFRLT